MISTYNLIKLNKHISNPKSILPSGWRILLDSDKIAGLKETGYHGYAFVNHNTKEFVIASSGTNKGERGIEDFLADLASDFQILSGEVPAQLTDGALPFARGALAQHYHPSYKIYFTGHSLGAVLAELSKVYFDANGYALNSQAVTFDSPGSMPILAHLGYEGNTPLPGITIYNGAPNVINTCNKQAGLVHQLYKDKVDLVSTNSAMQDILDYVKHTNGLHSLDNLFKSFNAETSLPYHSKLVRDWPVITEKNRDYFKKIISSVNHLEKPTVALLKHGKNFFKSLYEDDNDAQVAVAPAVPIFNSLFHFFEGMDKLLENVTELTSHAGDTINTLGLCSYFGTCDEV
jgi:hypothetical protein